MKISNMLKKIVLLFSLFLLNSSAFARCPSVATLKLESTGYQGLVNIELRKGVRPGSSIVASDTVITRGVTVISDICAGRYFFAFGTPDSDQVSTTQYFDVINDGNRYSMPTITVV